MPPKAITPSPVPERRAHLRAELKVPYLPLLPQSRRTADEVRYIVDPANVIGSDYPSETFRVLKEGELRAYGEYARAAW